MKYPDLLRVALLAVATVGAGGVLAQTTAPSQTTPASNAPLHPPVVSDVAPPPAEDRSSTGALVVAPVRAQRANPAAAMGAGPSLKPIGRHANRIMQRRKAQGELERARAEEATQMQRGAAGQTAN